MMPERICDLHRSLLLVTGEQSRAYAVINDALRGMEKGTLWVSENAVTYKQASSLLGQEKSVVVFDAYDGIQPDALAAVTGLVVGGGCLILCLPEEAEWDTAFLSEFSKRFIRFINDVDFAKRIDINNKDSVQIIKNSLKNTHINSDFELTVDQLNVIEQIKLLLESEKKQSLVVVSDRGRGKSTSLGVVGAELLQKKNIKILITAPRFKACEVAFSTLQKNIEGSVIKQAKIQYQESEFKFMAPDEILRSDVGAELLLIDEAASIPLPLLKQLLDRFDKTVFVSTVHGYEGTGRGFSVRFSRDLDASVDQWQRIEMKTPVRWAEGDPLENWLFNLLCLDADVADIKNEIDTNNIKLRQITRSDLATNEQLLRQVFSLLVLAHYKTRPSDLQRMLDDEVVITIAESGDEVIAVVLSADEGGFDSDMSTAIYQGVRRPKGNLLAQTLTYHCGVENAACASSHRIMRIVVHPQCQKKGIGSLLLNHLANNLTDKGVDILGASFGLTKDLSQFWEKSGFKIVRVGLKKEQSSGEHAAVYVRAFTEQGLLIINNAQNRFFLHFPLLKQSALKDCKADYLSIDNLELLDQLSETEQQDIESFVKYSRSYELCIAGVDKWVRLNLLSLNNEADDIYRDVLTNVVLHKMDWKNTAKEMSLDGKKQAQVLFKQAVAYLWNKAQ